MQISKYKYLGDGYMENTIIEALFATKAVRVAPENQPFWYTSGRLGPFFINTQFLREN